MLKGGLSLGALAAAAFGAGGAAAAIKCRNDRPNLLVIMGDDIGYSDLGACGGDVDTPT